MLSVGALALAVGGALSALAALAHLACIVFGASAYRFMGAGERMARGAEARSLRPVIVTVTVATGLFIWAAYALSGAGIIGPLPGTKIVLLGVTLVYLARAVGFPLLKPVFPDNSTTFWLVSSSICLVLGLLHAFGLAAQWTTL